jgi:hypothetical protein
VIPAFTRFHVLPPFEGERIASAHSSPYPVTCGELVRRFASGAERCAILDGLLRYRSELRGLGFAHGFQWLDGSFVEDVETLEKRPPRDIDVVTFAYPPPGLSQEQTRNLLRQRPDLFDQARCKQDFRCDVNIVNLSTAPEWLVTQTRYWYGLFSHRRADALWKGMLQLPLDSDDELARTALATLQGDTDARSA